jgi:hypothetical protein
VSTVTIDDRVVVRARVQLPAFGVWWADVEIAEAVAMSGAVVVRVSDLELHGTIVSGGPYQGASRYRIAAGAAGWGRNAPAKSYANDLGVKRSTVLTDAAAVAGETLDAATIPTGTVGTAYVREAGACSLALHHLAPEAWYVGEDGVTRIGRRPSQALTSEAIRVNTDLARGVVELAADSVAQIVPGVVVDDLEAVDVQHELADKKLRTTLWTTGLASTSRRVAAMRRLVLQLMPDVRFRGVFEYRIATQEGDRLNLQAVRASQGLPDLSRVRVRPGVPGARADHVLGSLVLVAFVDAEPTRPVVISFDDAEAPGFAPDRLDLVGEDDIALAVDAPGRGLRYGDTIMMPVGAAGTPTPTVIVANPIGASSLSRVRI